MALSVPGVPKMFNEVQPAIGLSAVPQTTLPVFASKKDGPTAALTFSKLTPPARCVAESLRPKI